MKAEEIVKKYCPEIITTRNGVEGIIPNLEVEDWKRNMETIRKVKPEIIRILKKRAEERQGQKKQEELKEKETLEKDIETGKAFLVLQVTKNQST